jgi:enamine deaminase RidA (YjgF/YER057c/UK114 family)
MTGGAMRFLQPEGWAPPKGYANGVEAEGRMVFVAGQVGWNPATGEFETDDLAGQVHQALMNVARVLREAGARPEHVVRMTWYLTDRDAYLIGARQIGSAYRETFGRHYPAMSAVIVAGLVESRARVEIEATAVVPREGTGR